MKAMDFGRVVTAMVTPFDEQLQIDWDAAGRLVDYLIDEQLSDSLVVCGTTGESATLSDEEMIKLMAFCVHRAKGRCKIIGGTGSNDTAHAVHLTEKAEQSGVDGILLVAPYYNRPSQEGLYQHFSTIAAHTKLPVMLYNIPKRSGVNIEASTIARLAQIPNIVATKEAFNDFNQLAALIDQTPDTFRVYSGDDELALPMMAVGAYGVVSVVSHIAGREVKNMVRAFLKGQNEEAAQLHRRLIPVIKAVFHTPSPAPVKYALKLRGLNVGGVRLPLVWPNEEEQAFIRKGIELD